MRFDLVMRDPDALFNIFAKQQRDTAVIEASDAERRQTAKRRDSRSMAAAGTKPQRSTTDGHDSREKAKAAVVKAELNRRYGNKECFGCGKQGHKQLDCPQSQQGRAGKGAHSHSQDQTSRLYSSSSPQAVPLCIAGARQPGWPPRLPPFELVGTRPPQGGGYGYRTCWA